MFGLLGIELYGVLELFGELFVTADGLFVLFGELVEVLTFLVVFGSKIFTFCCLISKVFSCGL